MSRSIEYKLEVMTAYKEGRSVESRSSEFDCWEPQPNPVWDWRNWDYRVAPKSLHEISRYRSENVFFSDKILDGSIKESKRRMWEQGFMAGYKYCKENLDV